jgi:IS30 family transposase
MTKKYTQLSLEQRYQIAAFRQLGYSQTRIAKEINRSKSTISREIKRNMPHGGTGRGVYDASNAEYKTRYRHKNKKKHRKFTDKMKKKVKLWLEKEKLSPEFISKKGRQEFGEFVSAEIIYRWIWFCKFSDRSENRPYKFLYKELIHGKKRGKRGNYKRKRGEIPNRKTIEQRPKIVLKRQRIGDLEGDLMLGKNHQAGLLVMIDRASLKVKLKKIKSKEAKYIANCMNHKLCRDKRWIKTLTLDNDSAFTEHERVSNKIGCRTYFTRPYTSQDKGTVENRIGVIRRFFPKQTDFSQVDEKMVKEVERKINRRPIRKFNYLSAEQIFKQLICA